MAISTSPAKPKSPREVGREDTAQDRPDGRRRRRDAAQHAKADGLFTRSVVGHQQGVGQRKDHGRADALQQRPANGQHSDVPTDGRYQRTHA